MGHWQLKNPIPIRPRPIPIRIYSSPDPFLHAITQWHGSHHALQPHMEELSPVQGRNHAHLRVQLHLVGRFSAGLAGGETPNACWRHRTNPRHDPSGTAMSDCRETARGGARGVRLGRQSYGSSIRRVCECRSFGFRVAMVAQNLHLSPTTNSGVKRCVF